MFAHRIAGVLRQYHDPLVAFLTVEVLLGPQDSSWHIRGTPTSYYLDSYVGPSADITVNAYLVYEDLSSWKDCQVDGEGLRDQIEEWIAAGAWWHDGYPQLNQHLRQDLIVPWVARLVNAWLKELPHAEAEAVAQRLGGEQPNAVAEHCKILQKLSVASADIADWALAERPNLMKLTLNQALHRSRRWHAALKRKQAAAVAPPSEVVFTQGNLAFHSLTTRRALRHEGECQRHCVGSYWDDVQSGQTMIFSLRDRDNIPKATLEVRSGHLVQFRGPANRQVKKEELLQATSNFLAYMGFAPRSGLPPAEAQANPVLMGASTMTKQQLLDQIGRSVFLNAYFEAIAFTEDVDIEKFTKADLEWLVRDAEAFLDLPKVEDALFGLDYTREQLGHDLWLTRNRHGAGFWDGDWPEPAAMILTDAAHTVREIEIYTNDRGHPRVYGR